MNHPSTVAVRGGILALAALLSACGGSDNDAAESTPPPAALTKEQICQQTASAAMPDATLTTVQHYAQGDFTTPTNAVIADVPSFCRVAATLRPSPDSDIKVEVWLPAENWNGKYLGLGNGGFAGALNFPSLAAGLRRGYAVAHTDMGTAPAGDGTPLQNHPEKWIDWGYRSTHLMTLLAKDTVNKYYSKGPAKSYFFGCSTGGGQGLHEAQRFPADYDGIVAGAPAHNRVSTHTSVMWSWAASRVDAASALPAEKRTLLSNAVLAACDAADGLVDGIVSRPEACTFSPRALQCTAADAPDCLNASQVVAVEKIYAGPKNTATGAQIFPGLFRGSESQWGFLTAPADPGALPPFGGIFTWVFGSNFDWRSYDYGKDAIAMENALGAATAAVNPDLKEFRARGGKIISYQGLADVIVGPGEIPRYLQQVESTTGQTGTFMRLFNVPGMGHCSGGAAPNVFGNTLTAAPFAGDPNRDVLTALERWVENGTVPTRLVATQYSNGNPTTGTVVRTRPICPYPQVARYNATGDANLETSFTCAAP